MWYYFICIIDYGGKQTVAEWQLYGRKRIYTDIVPTGIIAEDIKIIPQILYKSIPVHTENVGAMDRLVNYFYNHTAIDDKIKISRPEVNNKVSIPRANTTVTTINSYCFSNPFKFISLQAEQEITDELKNFNDCCELDNYSAKLIETTQWSGVTGIGYKFVSKPNAKDIENGMFFKTTGDIDPRTAFCVYANTIDKEKVLGVIFHEKTEEQNGITMRYTEYNVFTKWHQWRFKTQDFTNFSNIKFPIILQGNLEYIDAYPLNALNTGVPTEENSSTIPLIEYLRKPDRTNDFEKSILLMDAISVVLSNSVDATTQNSDYVFKFKNVDVGEWDENGVNPVLETIKQALKNHILPIKEIEGAQNQPDAEILEIPLNQSEVRSLLEYLTEQLEESLFVPNRNTSSGGADTNSSVETRNGFRSLEDIAGIITSQAIKSEKEFIQCALEIGKQQENCPFPNLKAKDIGIKPMRNKIESLINSTQAFATMINSGVNRITAYVVSGLVADATDTAAMDRLEADEKFQRSVQQEIERKKALQAVTPQEEQTQTENDSESNNTDTQNDDNQ